MRLVSILACLVLVLAAMPVVVSAQTEGHACEGVAFVGGYALLDEAGYSAAHGVLVNFGPEEITLTEITSPNAESIIPNQATVTGHEVEIAPIADAITIPVGRFWVVEPTGASFGLVGLDAEIGDSLPLSFAFDDGTTLEAEIPVQAPPTDEMMHADPISTAEIFASGHCEGVQIVNGWVRPSVTLSGAAYGLVLNLTEDEITLKGGATEIAEVVEIHEMIMHGDVMQMNPLPDGLAIPAGGFALLRPGGHHLMLINLTGELVDGEDLELSLDFEGTDTLELTLPIGEPSDAADDGHGDHGGGHGH